MAKLKLTLPTGELAVTGKQVTFVAPCDSAGLTHITIEDLEFELVDSNGKSLLDGAFKSQAMVSVILNVESKKAFIQNADINYQLKEQFDKKVNTSISVVNDESKHIKAVPQGKFKYAKVNKIGGMTRKCNNLLSYPYYHTTKRHNGIDFTDNGDGSVTINGQNGGTAQSTFYIAHRSEKPLHLKAGSYCVSINNNINICVADGTNTYRNSAFTLSAETDVAIHIQIPSGDTTYFDNVTVYPMLNEGSTALPYEPYSEGFRDTAVTELKGKGANLIPYPYNPYTISNGITFTDNGDGSITINGQNDGNNPSVFYMHRREYPITIKAGTYFNSGNLAMTLFGLDGKYTSFGYKKATTIEADITGGLYIQVSKTDTTVYNNFVVYPMLNEGLKALPYSPYKTPTSPIPEEIQALDGYGRGVEGYPNYADFDRKVFIQNTYRKVFDGTENLILAATASATGGLYRFQFILPYKSVFESNNKAVPLICNLYNTVSGDATWKGVTGVSITNGTSIHFFDTNYQTVDEWIAHLKELYDSGNPLIVEYAMETPIETDISHILPDIVLPVEEGGSIELVNEYGYDMPNTMIFYESNNEIVGADTFVGKLIGDASHASTSDFAFRDSKGNIIASTYGLAPIISTEDIVAGVTPLAEGQSYHIYE